MESDRSLSAQKKLDIPAAVDVFLAEKTNECDGFQVGKIVFSMDDDGRILIFIGSSRVVLNRSGIVLNDALDKDIETAKTAISRLLEFIETIKNQTESTIE